MYGISADVDPDIRRKPFKAGPCQFRKFERDGDGVPHDLLAIVEVAWHFSSQRILWNST